MPDQHLRRAGTLAAKSTRARAAAAHQARLREAAEAMNTFIGLFAYSTTAEAVDERLRRLRSAQEEKKLAVERRRDIHIQIRALLKEAKAASRKVEAKERGLRSKAEAHGQLACLDLYMTLYATLPPELRNMVYDGIIGPYHYEHVRRNGDLNKPGMLGGASLNFINPQLLEHGSQSLRWWLDEYMGRCVATEIVEHWYHTRTFEFRARYSSMLPKFLWKDVFDKGVKPGILVQHIRYHINTVDIVSAAWKAHLIEKMWVIGTIKNNNVDLTVCIDSEEKGDDTAKITSVLEVIGPIFYWLRNDGFKRLSVKKTSSWSDLTHLFGVPEDTFMATLKDITMER